MSLTELNIMEAGEKLMEEEEDEEVLQTAPHGNSSEEISTKNKAKRKAKSKKKPLEGEMKCILTFLQVGPCTVLVGHVAQHAKPATLTLVQ